ncbi:MAG: VTT domain-containing protein [Firmicutes bacterium]|nr:VTT domain-containing protein [Bacillota bacterium]
MKKAIPIIKLLLLLCIVIVIPANIVLYHHDIIDKFENFEDVIAFLEHYHWQSILVYIAIQTVQVIISVIPGQAFQFAAGYLYTFLPGLLFSLIGAALGTFVSFFLAKVLGKDAIHLFLGEAKTAYYVERLNSRRAYAIVFLIYLIPGIPKDIVSYAAGISEMEFHPFFIFSMMGRLPGMAGSLLIGALYMREHYVWMGIVAAVAIIAFVAGVIYRKKLHGYLDKLYDKVTH